jgi:DNA ligase (NAD+)
MADRSLKKIMNIHLVNIKEILFECIKRKDQKCVFKLLRQCDEEYFLSAKPLLTERDYDMIKAQAQKLWPSNSYFSKVGITISKKIEKVKKIKFVKLPYILGSLRKFKPDTIQSWLMNTKSKYEDDDNIVISEKMDGLTIYVEYKDGIPIRGMTRGDSSVGQDITEKVKIFCPKIKSSGSLILRGEAMLVKDSHITLGFTTRRNGASGIINTKKFSKEKVKHLIPFFYEIINSSPTLSSESDRFTLLNSLKLKTPKWIMRKKSEITPDYLITQLQEWRRSAEYDIDGVVLCINKSNRENVKKPKLKVAFKTNESCTEVIVDHIQWNITRTGRLVPIVIIKDPPIINSVKISKVTAHNAKYIVDNKIGSGSKICIIRSGDVIPYIEEVITPSTPSTPTKCPFCDKKLKWSSVDLICENPKCEEQHYYKIAHFLKQLKVKGLSVQTIKNLNITILTHLFKLTIDDIKAMDGFSEKSAINIVNELKKAKTHTDPANFLSGLGIDMLGSTVSKLLVDKFTLNELFNIDTWSDTQYNKLTRIPGIGTSVVGKLKLHLPNFKQAFQILKKTGFTFKEARHTQGHKSILNGLTFVLTGTGPMDREKLIETIEFNGGNVVTSITKNVDFLVTNDLSSTSGKMKKASEYNISIVSYKDVLDMIN